MTNPNHQTFADFMARADIVECQLVPWGSNYTFAALLHDPDGHHEDALAIYKPAAGEIPLWDFPDDTLYIREYAAYLVSVALGWDIVPPTIIREGPHGIGSMQQYIEPDAEAHYFTVRKTRLEELRRVALFDIATNNADRKASHCIVGINDDKLWGIDHGLTFNVQPKLRTVIWDFQMQPIEACLRERLACVAEDQDLDQQLRELLTASEVDAFRKRADALYREGTFPPLRSQRSIPWGW